MGAAAKQQPQQEFKYQPKQLIERNSKMKADRAQWENHWQECADYILPRKANIAQTITPGSKLNTHLFDNTAIQANELLAGALHGLLTNPNSIWFELTTGEEALDELDNVRAWLQLVGRRMHNVLNNSNFQTEVHELYMDLTCFGTSGMTIEEDDDIVVRFSTRHIGELYMSENNKGIIDEVHRNFRWNPQQLVAEYGIKNVGKKVREAFNKGENTKFEVIHAVYPKVKKTAKGFAFSIVSQHVLVDGAIELQVKGFNEFPYVTPRWTKASGETYGRSPGMNALPEAKTINKMTETVLKGAQKVVDPPLMVPDDGFMLPIITRPGGLNFYRSGTDDRIEPFANDARIDFGYQAMTEKRTRIREAFFVDQLQLNTGPQMTATEVLQRTEERMRLLGPMLGRQQAEFLRPLIDRVFEIMVRRGMIPELPQELADLPKLDVQYSSMIAKSQKLSEGQNILRTVEAIAPFAAADPTVLDNIDGDKAVRAIAKIYGLPQSILRDQDKIEALRDARAQAQQKLAERAQQSADVDAVSKVVPAVAQVAKAG